MLKFVAIKYLSLALNASRSLVLAALLGPQSFGVLGTLIVVQQYLSYAALGMREGITVRLAQGGSNPANVLRSSALAWGLSVGLVIVIGFVAFDRLVRPLGEQWIWVGLISLLSIANSSWPPVLHKVGDPYPGLNLSVFQISSPESLSSAIV